MIVALTSCLMMIIQRSLRDTPHYDTARVAAQVVSGISFIGGRSSSCVAAREWTTTASKFAGIGLVAEDSGSSVPFAPRLSSSKNGLSANLYQRETTSNNIY